MLAGRPTRRLAAGQRRSTARRGHGATRPGHSATRRGHGATRPGHSTGRGAAAAIALAAAALLAASCSSAAGTGGKPPAGGGQTSTAVTRCGTTRTAANVPVNVEVEHGQVSCATAMTVERGYAKAILDGNAPGNGGGGPVTVQGWTCQGFPTPVVLKTGQASKCVSGASEILAILPDPA